MEGWTSEGVRERELEIPVTGKWRSKKGRNRGDRHASMHRREVDDRQR